MKVNWAWLSLAVLLLSGCGHDSVAGTPLYRNDEEYNKGLEQVRELSKGPLDVYQRGGKLTDAAKKNLIDAERIVDGLIMFAPAKYGPFILAGKIAQALEDNTTARQRYEQALRLEPVNSSPTVRYALSDVLFQLAEMDMHDGKFEDANEHASLAIGMEPKNADYFVSKGNALLQLKQFDQAKKVLKEALKLNPDHERAQTLLRILDEVSSSKK